MDCVAMLGIDPIVMYAGGDVGGAAGCADGGAASGGHRSVPVELNDAAKPSGADTSRSILEAALGADSAILGCCGRKTGGSVGGATGGGIGGIGFRPTSSTELQAIDFVTTPS